MCGIAGMACRPGIRPDAARLDAMSAALWHRGPDGAGALDTESVALRHRRLSIVDLQGGAQPLRLDSRALVANGEIYNDLDLRASMPDVRFGTGSDCEPPLALWPREGMRYAAMLRGMYAIALTDMASSDGELVLSRDPFGIKPLYLAAFDDGIAFASEARALLAGGFGKREALPQARDALLALQFVPGDATIYPGIRRLRPGETVRISGGRIVDRHRLRAFPDRTPPDGMSHGMSETEALARLDEALLDSVSAHERADVPFGLFLSGGVDSASILAAMKKLGQDRPCAWTARFDAGAVDESAEAARLARLAGAEHRVFSITEEMFWADLPRIVGAMDDPVADYAIVPTWFLAREAARDVKVILSGEGGDELFAGYGRYRRAMRPWWRGGRAPYRRGAMERTGLSGGEAWKSALRVQATARGPEARLHAVQALDVAEWLPNDLLIKLDRCLMAHAVEGRTPLLDPVVARIAASLPTHMKIRDGRGKYLLRRWLEDNLPGVDAFAPKQGFTVPVAAWIAKRSQGLAPLMARTAALQTVGSPQAISAVVRNTEKRRHGKAAWHLLFYALWHRIHIEGVAPDGDVFEILTAC
ncbi:asparagine synthase (glutamine-hydrolyzing) [Brytella acorum]|uniref:asparagine synthase (glutamine-hydrolyzing) n=1 Tax=Brytella acorum TaxID=2959299 RepID=A0AA35VA38_9PROT|nr:asparagine synthase (glutamine-hydrolyzing) [Brytella acorum]MDF3624435.1 asparagine synthase (glutamine-hydrolyzing) [Brytella acorum]CAI9119715.1 asparagine synthase (glutamine-hydrolyzing) [Brytella acorum]